MGGGVQLDTALGVFVCWENPTQLKGFFSGQKPFPDFQIQSGGIQQVNPDLDLMAQKKSCIFFMKKRKYKLDRARIGS